MSNEADQHDPVYDHIDVKETSPMVRVGQLQELRLKLLKSQAVVSKEELALIKQIGDTDLSLLRIETDKDVGQSRRELALALGEAMLNVTGNPLMLDQAPAQSPGRVMEVTEDILPEEEIPDWSTGTEPGSLSYEEVMGDDA